VRTARVDSGCSTDLSRSRVAQLALADEKTTVSLYPTLSETAAAATATARRSVYASAIIKAHHMPGLSLDIFRPKSKKF